MRLNLFLQSLTGLGTALCFSSSSIFIRYGLETIPSPLFGVTVGMTFCTVTSGFILLNRYHFSIETPKNLYSRKGVVLLFIAGTFEGIGTLSRWVAIALAPIAIVISSGGLTIPVVLILSPILMGRKVENVTLRVWLGAGFIIWCICHNHFWINLLL